MSISPLSSLRFLKILSMASLATVRIVPSTGFATAVYARSTPHLIAAATCPGVALSSPEKPAAIPAKSCDRMTPEFPRALISIPEASVSAALESSSEGDLVSAA